MNNVYFANNDTLDLDVIKVMGVSVKNNENPIGYFGTGLKYAISVLLRNDHKVVLKTNGEKYTFTTRPIEIRGVEFQGCFINDEKLPFTTDLGKNWEVWQAFRELYSNTLDELGDVSDQPLEDNTVLIVQGAACHEAYLARDEIFLRGEPAIKHGNIEIHRKPSKYLYYRGVRVWDLPKPSIYTYNIIDGQKLTEDRTIDNTQGLMYRLANTLPEIEDERLADAITCKAFEEKSFEHELDYSQCSWPSKEFLDSLSVIVRAEKCPANWKQVYKNHRKQERSAHYQELNASQKKLLEKVVTKYLKHLDVEVTIDWEQIRINPKDENGILQGYYDVKADKIVFTQAAFNRGEEWLASTYFEEWIHATTKNDDYSHNMQAYLFDRIMGLLIKIEEGK